MRDVETNNVCNAVLLNADRFPMLRLLRIESTLLQASELGFFDHHPSVGACNAVSPAKPNGHFNCITV